MMSAPQSRAADTSSTPSEPASVTKRPAACAAVTQGATWLGAMKSNSERPSLRAVSSKSPAAPNRAAVSTTRSGRHRPRRKQVGVEAKHHVERATGVGPAAELQRQDTVDDRQIFARCRSRIDTHFRDGDAGSRRGTRGGLDPDGRAVGAQVTEGGADWSPASHGPRDRVECIGAHGPQRSLRGILGVDDVGPRVDRDCRLVRVADADQKAHGGKQ